MPILKIANLEKVWLMLKMFPEDTSNLRIGQSVAVAIQSQAGQTFEGQISFIDPIIDTRTQTVNVRVAIPNDSGLIKIGDFGKAKIQASAIRTETMVVVPREAVLINGDQSVAYVETERNRFEFRKVQISQIMGDQITLSSGIKPGEMVVASGAFMLDSTFNIQGKASIIDPNRGDRDPRDSTSYTDDRDDTDENISKEDRKEMEASFTSLSPSDPGNSPNCKSSARYQKFDLELKEWGRRSKSMSWETQSWFVVKVVAPDCLKSPRNISNS